MKGQDEVSIVGIVSVFVVGMHTMHFREMRQPRGILDLKCPIGPEAAFGKRVSAKSLIIWWPMKVSKGAFESDDGERLALRFWPNNANGCPIPLFVANFQVVGYSQMMLVRYYHWAWCAD